MHRRHGQFLSLVVATGALFAAHAGAQSSGGAYRIDPVVVASGGEAIAADGLELRATFGQAMTATLSGAAYRLHGGFWSPAASDEVPDLLFADGFEP